MYNVHAEMGLLAETMKVTVESDMKELDLFDKSERTIAILGDRWWPPAAEQEQDKKPKPFPRKKWNQRSARLTIGGVYIRGRNGASSLKAMGGRCWSHY